MTMTTTTMMMMMMKMRMMLSFVERIKHHISIFVRLVFYVLKSKW
jgi:hypothetical protein